MAWLERTEWLVEQGVDALLELLVYEDEERTEPWVFTDWTVVGTVGDENGTLVCNCVVQTTPAEGRIRFIILEADVNALNPNKRYFFNGLMISPSSDLADDHHVAYLPLSIQPRTSRRPAP